MNVGDWVFFRTRNWPNGVRTKATDSALEDITGNELYLGRGKIIGIAGSNHTVREEKTNRLVEVGPHPEDEIHALRYEYRTLTFGDLRAFVEEHKDVPDDLPVTIPLPVAFFSDEDDLPADHPEYKAASVCHSVEACGIFVTGVCEDGNSTDQYIPSEHCEWEEWDFCIEIILNSEQCYEAMREYVDE